MEVGRTAPPRGRHVALTDAERILWTCTRRSAGRGGSGRQDQPQAAGAQRGQLGADRHRLLVSAVVGDGAAMSAMAAAERAARAQNGPRQPMACPANAPSGTPTTLASMAPAPTSPRARELAAGPAARAAATLATAQKAPVAIAVRNRAARTRVKLALRATSASTCRSARRPSPASRRPSRRSSPASTGTCTPPTAGRPAARAAAASAGREHEVSEGEQDFGGAPLVHGLVALRGLADGASEVEDLAGADSAAQTSWIRSGRNRCAGAGPPTVWIPVKNNSMPGDAHVVQVAPAADLNDSGGRGVRDVQRCPRVRN